MEEKWTIDFVRNRLEDLQFDMAHSIALKYIDMDTLGLKSLISWIGLNGVVEIECSTRRVSMFFEAILNGSTFKLTVGPHLRDSGKVFIIGLFEVRKSAAS